MKTQVFFILFLIMVVTICSCKKDEKDEPVELPIIATMAISDITDSTATSGGNISSDGNSAITSRGVCWSISPDPTILGDHTTDGTEAGTFASQISGLEFYRKYYVRAYATNKAGTAYGNQLVFTTDSTFMDADGILYHTVRIGSQVWMKENLKVTKYRNGDPIPNLASATSWINATSGAYCEYNNNSAYVSDYGRLYSWSAVMDPRILAPEGWHVPNENDWTTLALYVGGFSVAGSKLKESGTEHWNSPNTGSTNEYGFDAFGAGCRWGNSNFEMLGTYAHFWLPQEQNSTDARIFRLDYSNTTAIFGYGSKKNGFSVRCIKD